MRILLDTSVVLRVGAIRTPVSQSIHQRLVAADQLVLTALARAEIGIKLSIGKLTLPMPEQRFWHETKTLLQAVELPFTSAHAALLADLPLHHRDPFDRMIAAQCLAEGLTLATTDSVFKLYGVEIVS